MKLKRIVYNLCYFLLCIIVFSCKATKNMYYLNDISHLSDTVNSLIQKAKPTIQVGDRVSIVVSCADPNQTNFLNPINNQNPGMSGTNNSNGYLVDSMGFIDFPLIGKLKIVGDGTLQATNKIKEKLKPFFKDPYVYLNLQGRVFIINGRGGYSAMINNERLTIFEALAQQGSYEPDDKWNEVMIVREKNGNRTIETIDLTTKNILNSPYYYLQNNDLIYVKPGKLNATMRSTNTVRTTIGLITGTLALLLLLLKR